MGDDSIEKVTIKHDLGLHLRAAGALVQTASKYDADVTISYNNLTANCKSIMSVLSLAAPCGARLEIRATGNQAAEALKAVVDLVERDFDL